MTSEERSAAARAILLLAFQYGLVPTESQMDQCDSLCADGWDGFLAAWVVAGRADRGMAARFTPGRSPLFLIFSSGGEERRPLPPGAWLSA